MKFCTSIVGIFALLFSAAALFAAPWTGGSGTANDPYRVGTPQDLKAIATEINAGNYADSCFKLIADIDLNVGADTQFTAIGTWENSFRGVFDGDSHIISNLYINQSASDYQGLFGYALNADIRNIGLDSVWVIGGGNAGGLIGWAANGTTVSNAYATGSVTGVNRIGGLIGYTGESTVSNAYATGSVTGVNRIGGLIGYTGESTVSNAYATGSVSGTENFVGGLIGYANGTTVTNAYATGSVSGQYAVGGLIGGAVSGTTVTNAYVTGSVSGTEGVGGLIGGSDIVTVSNAYWDKESTGQNTSEGGVGKTTAELKTPRFARTLGMNAWRWDESQELNNGYPVLVSQGGTVVLWDGNGTQSDPFQIANAEDLKAIAAQVNAGNYADSCFKLTADIDLDSTVQGEFTAIGTDTTRFRGVFDGGSHIISNLYINQPDSNYQGLFGYAQNADIRNIGLDSAWVIGGGKAGGLIGMADGTTVTNAYATGSVSGNMEVGGLIGWAENGTTVSDVYVTGRVSGTKFYVGGLIGYAKKSSVTNAYATGSVSGKGDVGGLIGYANGTTVVNAYWDKESTGQNASLGGIAKTTAELKTPRFARTLGMNAWRWDENQELNNGYPVLAFQGGTKIFIWDGNGTQSDPFQIANAEDLKNVVRQVNLKNYADSAFKLTADINLDSTVQGEFTAIGTKTTPFRGVFDGDSHIISNLYINQPDSNYQSLFGYAVNADIRNIGLDSAWVIGSSCVGGLIGVAANGTTVTNASATGSVSGLETVGGLIGSAFGGMVANASATGSVSGGNAIGGLIGVASNSPVTNASATGRVSGKVNVGGLIGYVENGTTVTNAYATGSVAGMGGGGLIGYAKNSTVTNAYATGSVSGNYIGGLIGAAGAGTTISNAYATGSVSGEDAVGGLIGWAENGTTVTNAYWDKESTGQNASAGGVGKTTAELKTPRFARTLGMNAWRWDEPQKLNKGYPVLVSQGGTVVLWDGNGTQSDPFQIANAADLKAVAVQVNAGNYADSCFKLTKNIDLDSTVQGEFTAIGTLKNSFRGVFDGGSHIISNLYINQPDSDYQGLFKHVDKADIQNIGLVFVSVSGGGYTGGLIGWARSATVRNAYATGSVSGQNYTGGLIGYTGNSSVTNAYAGSVSGKNSVGGLIGMADGTTVMNAYAAGNVSGTGNNVGGLIGYANGTTVTNAYWDKESTGQSISAGGGEGKTTAELKNSQFARTLGINAWRWDKTQKLNKGYPVLVSQGGVIPPVPSAVGKSIEVKGSDFGTLGGNPVTIDKKTAFLATYIPPFKTNAKPKKLSVKLDKTTLDSPVQELDIKGFVSLLNTKLYKQQLRTPMTTREILLADSVAHAVQREGLLVDIVVKGKKNAVSTDSVTLVMVPPAIDSVVVITVDSGSRKEALYAVTAVRDLGTKAKGRLETVQNSKVKKTSVSFVKERKWSSISEIADTVSGLEILYPDASVSVLKLPKKFKTLTSPDLVIDNRNGLNAVAMPK